MMIVLRKSSTPQLHVNWATTPVFPREKKGKREKRQCETINMNLDEGPHRDAPQCVIVW